jgi:uncharacterized protein YyaL (SSP411 family)
LQYKEYVNTLEEDQKIKNPNHFQAFLDFYTIEKEGNWEDTNIVYCTESIENFALRNNLDLFQLKADFSILKNHLYTIRDKRIKPLRDEKHWQKPR